MGEWNRSVGHEDLATAVPASPSRKPIVATRLGFHVSTLGGQSVTGGQSLLAWIHASHKHAVEHIRRERWMEAWFDIVDAETATNMGRAIFRGVTTGDIPDVIGAAGAALLVKLLSQGRMNACEMALIEDTMEETIRLRQLIQTRYFPGFGEEEYEYMKRRLEEIGRGWRRQAKGNRG